MPPKFILITFTYSQGSFVFFFTTLVRSSSLLLVAVQKISKCPKIQSYLHAFVEEMLSADWDQI